MTEQLTSRNLNARDAIESIRSGLSNAELMQKFKISPKGLADLLTQLFEKRLISEEDLAARGIRFRVVKKETIPEPVPQLPPQMMEQSEEFLDTVELTELLAFKIGEISAPPKKPDPPPPTSSPEEREEPKTPASKGRFSLSSLFRKDR